MSNTTFHLYICAAQLLFVIFVSYYTHGNIIFDVDAEGPSEEGHVQVRKTRLKYLCLVKMSDYVA